MHDLCVIYIVCVLFMCRLCVTCLACYMSCVLRVLFVSLVCRFTEIPSTIYNQLSCHTLLRSAVESSRCLGIKEHIMCSLHRYLVYSVTPGI